MQKRKNARPVKMLDEIVLDTKAVVKVTKGGRQRRFQAVVLVGDRKGLVGLGIGKANEVSEAVKKLDKMLIRMLLKFLLQMVEQFPMKLVNL